MLKGDIFFGEPSFQKKATPRKGVRTLIPVQPSKVIAVGLNYMGHAQESEQKSSKTSIFWLKAPISLIVDGCKIAIPFAENEVHSRPN